MEADKIQLIKFIPNTEWIIGRSYCPDDNSYIASQDGNTASLVGARSLVIISQPYLAKVFSEIRKILHLADPEHQFVNVIDTFSGVRYRCLFDVRFVSRDPVKSIEINQAALINKHYIVKDNSYIEEVNLNGNKINDFSHMCTDMRDLAIVSYPFEGKGKTCLGEEFDAHWVIAQDRATGRYYRIPYNPGWVGCRTVPTREVKKVVRPRDLKYFIVL